MFYEIILSSVFLWFIIKDAINHRRTDKLLNRIMAKNYEEYRYYENKYPGDLEELKNLRDEGRQERVAVEQELFTDEAPLAKENTNDWEEDWSPVELDQSKVIIKKG